MTEVIKEIERLNIGKVEKNVSLSKYTTYKVGGIARAIVYPKNDKNLIKLLQLLRRESVPYKVIGNGSNLLFSDKRYEGIIIKLNEFNDLKFVGKTKIVVGAGYSLMKLSLLTIKKGLAGMEFAAGIPGTIGGAVFMNAGAYKSDMGYIVQSIKVLTPDFKVITLENKELNFHYRSSFLQKNPRYICLEATLKLEKGNKSALEEVVKERRKRRTESQPLEYPSAGSVFRNPEGHFAGQMIEELGLKGRKYGGAMVSEKHANFIINFSNASSNDIRNLIEYVHDKVLEKYNIDMKVEQEFVNWE